MRCFFALDLPVPVRNHLARIARESLTKGKVRKVSAEQLHVTLLFAGDIPPEATAALRDLLFAVEAEPMTFSLAGLGHFPPRGEPRVIWAGLDGDVEALAEVQRRMAEGAADLGIPPDKRPFTPHVTLGRVKSPFGAYAIPDELREVGPTLNSKPFRCHTATLYESRLAPGGATYHVIARRDLGEG